MVSFDHFDFVARWYDQLAGADGDESVRAAMGVEAGQWVLDVGGGTGRHSAPLAAAGARVTVCDMSRGMLEQAQAKGLTGVYGSVTQLPFPDASVDRALVVDAFHHFTLPDGPAMQVTAAFELLRVLKPGGRLVVSEPDIRLAGVKAVAWGERLLLMHSRFLSPPQMAALFQSAGGRIVSLERRGYNAQIVVTK
jgi:ubiquinone/menaquinone biosynthesis C-methylase UbiE